MSFTEVGLDLFLRFDICSIVLAIISFAYMGMARILWFDIGCVGLEWTIVLLGFSGMALFTLEETWIPPPLFKSP